VDGRKNTLLQSTFVRDLPMYSACFTPDGTEVGRCCATRTDGLQMLASSSSRCFTRRSVQIFMSGRRPFFYIFDLETAMTVKVPELQGEPKACVGRRGGLSFLQSPDHHGSG
jgi:U3 small nucleolar RNA-associated protein 18